MSWTDNIDNITFTAPVGAKDIPTPTEVKQRAIERAIAAHYTKQIAAGEITVRPPITHNRCGKPDCKDKGQCKPTK